MKKRITIPFHHEMEKAIIENRKCCTSKNKKQGNVGDWFVINDNTYRLTFVLRCTLEEVATEYYKDEGVDSTEAFITMWNKLHPILGYVPTKLVYTHWFEEEKSSLEKNRTSIHDKLDSIEQLSHVMDGMTPEQIKEFEKHTKRRG